MLDKPLWIYIYEVLLGSAPLDKHQISDLLFRTYGISRSPELIRQSICREWKKGNFAIYAESIGNRYSYNPDSDYYNLSFIGVYGA